jgi:acetyl-CoA acetyltransferase
MRDVGIVEAVRSPFAKRGGGLAAMHSVDLFGAVQKAALDRAGVVRAKSARSACNLAT